MSHKEEILRQLELLIADGQRLADSYEGEDGFFESGATEIELRTFATASLAAIERVSGRSSEYYQSIPRSELLQQLSSVDGYVQFVPAATGALTALRSAIQCGMLTSLESRLRANIHDDFLAQANELLMAGYHVAGMVLVGGVLEHHLLKLVQARNLQWSNAGSLAKYNDLLRDVVYPQPTWRRIQSIADVRNEAAHGNGAQVKVDDVKDALNFTQRILTDHPL